MKLQIQSILFHNESDHVKRAAIAIHNAVNQLAQTRDVSVTLSYGDCSVKPCLDATEIESIRRSLGSIDLEYRFFNENLGSAKGHNLLAAGLDEGYVVIQNPDVVGEPSYLIHLAKCFEDAECGMAEARQLPIEHPKEYDPATGETGWATTACAMIPVALFRKLNGFDAATFFLYCDDLDFSWRARMIDKKIIFQPAAVVFHDKRLSQQAGWQPSSAERYFSIEASILMAHKWSRPERVSHLLDMCDRLDDPIFEKAARTYRSRLKSGELPTPIDPDHRVSVFEGDFFAKHRYAL